MNEQLNVEYLKKDITVHQNMTQYELAALLLDEDIFLLSVNQQKAVYMRRKKHKK